jgi:prepilin-type processing-associated H-X9-DG protein/prepilin-type N-terminal cleavage/methylation domain-containing protein
VNLSARHFEQRILRASGIPPERGGGRLRARETGLAFTLVELLVVIAVISVLAALLLPVLAGSKSAARRIQCVANLHQFGFAAQMYWDENAGNCFPYLAGSVSNGVTYWFGWLQNGAEGQRVFDATKGALYPYIQGRGIEICPSLNYLSAQFKLKATGAAYGYGYNHYLSTVPPVNVAKLTHPSMTAVLADAAQINTFEPPASRSNPMLEEFYYVDETAVPANGHFRHQNFANVLFCDSHVGLEKMVPGSLDTNLPSANVGRLRPEILLVP